MGALSSGCQEKSTNLLKRQTCVFSVVPQAGQSSCLRIRLDGHRSRVGTCGRASVAGAAQADTEMRLGARREGAIPSTSLIRRGSDVKVRKLAVRTASFCRAAAESQGTGPGCTAYG